MFEPIAITGRSCVLPGANTVEALWQAVVERRDLTTATPPEAWDAALVRTLGARAAGEADAAACARGGYVAGFDALFDPAGFGLEPRRVAALDPAFRWLLHCARQALDQGRVGAVARGRTGLVIGNLSYPSRGLADFACATWLRGVGRPSAEAPAENRFVSGLPAQFAARALGLGGPAFALDAACASSLYAVKLACDLLQDRSCDAVLAGGLNHADDLFLHVGFTALSALSPSGRSRPLTQKADGLLPAEGAALLTLKRLDDALAAGDRVFAVIRGVGLSNDGRERGLLAPDGKGQIRAMRQAYAVSGLEPASLGFVECHATGTAVGDGEEIRSMATLFAAARELPIGALKANLGHLITASGAAAILKMTAAFEAALLPPTLDAEAPLPQTAGTPLRVLARAEPWAAGGPRRAGVNAFGFGGNNAHLILEEPPARRDRAVSLPAPPGPVEIAICGVGVALGDAPDLAAFAERLRGAVTLSPNRQIDAVTLPGRNLRFPPADLRRSLGQQTLALAVAFQALAEVKPFDPMNCGVYFGMGCDAESARWALRWRLEELLVARDLQADEALLARVRDEAAPPLDATAVVGTMPNIPANRLSAQFDFRGPAFTVSAEELSGLEALRLARRALSRGEIEAALVGAVDLSCEPVHQAAVAALLPEQRRATADGAVALVLKRLDDAERAGDRILGVLPADAVIAPPPPADAVRRRFGQAHAAAGLLELLGGLVEGLTRSEIGEAGMRPALGPRGRALSAASFAGQEIAVNIAAAPEPLPLLRGRSGVWLRCFGAGDPAALLAALDRPAASAPGADCRLAVVARSRAELEERLSACRAALAAGTAPQGRGIHFRRGPALGEAALVFAGANAYPNVGAELFLAFPEIGDALAARFPVAREIADELYGPGGGAFIAQPFGALKAASLLCQAHALVAERLLGLKPQAVLGLSSGETNSLFAFGVWRDMTEMFGAIGGSGLYDEHLAGRLRAARTVWGLDAEVPLAWRSWLVSAPVAEVEALLRGNDRAEVSIRLSPGLCIVSGTEAGCEALLDRVGRQRAVQQAPTLICHSAVLEPFAASWAALHERETHPAPGLRFYSQSHNAAYAPTREAVRDALLDQARRPIDFGATVERAWQDGVRVFVEAGPRNILSRSIGEVLAGRPHLALSLDEAGRNPLEHLAGVAAQLFAAGVPLDEAALQRCFGSAEAEAAPKLALTLPARMAAFDAAPLAAVKPLAVAPAEVVPLSPAPQPPAGPATLHVFSRERPAAAEPRRPGLRPAAEPEAPEVIPPPYDRRQLERLAGGRISQVFGHRFRGQDGFPRQVRMPMPPLLLADRVVSIEGPAGEVGKGSIVTETDITAERWYLDEGRMPVGLLIESGQADLLLISWMGIDAHNRGDRLYRLLGCEITFHEGGMPRVGDTLRFDIHIDSHAQLGDVRMFFFRYDCRIGDRLVSSVRNGQAGFFSDAELAAAKGVNWTPPAPLSEGRRPLPDSLRPSARRAFSAAELEAFAGGDALACFGPGFEQAGAHQRTPKPPAGRMRMLDRIERFEPDGGPRGLGYLEAVAAVPVDAWFFEGHFLNDPCMPGTLMADAAVQALAFHMAALGLTLNRDGWRFEPATGEAFKFVCRGQVVPDRAHELRYEVFVTEIVDGPTPTVYATLLCTCDGLKVFHCPRFGLRLVPDWPVSTRPQWLEGAGAPRPVRPDGDVRGDHEAIVACAWGRPSVPFGATYAPFDREGRVPRLPGPPYLFVSRIRDVGGPAWKPVVGLDVVAEYDVPPDAWYFRDNDRPVMPFAVLSEVLLQPCGWLSSYAGFTLSGKAYLRNLDGSDAVQRIEVTPATGTLTTRATLTRFVRLGALTLVFFTVECRAGEDLVCGMTTSFGIFTAAELEKQAGLTVRDEVRAVLAEPAPAAPRDLSGLAGPLRLPGGRLRMVDEVTGFWPAAEGRPGRIRCRRAVSPYDWYFKAHFYEDPVQPGSLGLEALLQSLKAYLLLAGHGRHLAAPRFEPIALDQPLTWKYRGQVATDRKEVTTLLTVTVTETATEVLAVAEGTLWVDGLPIYEVANLAVRIAGSPAALAHRIAEFTPAAPAWVADHCPTYTRPALPFMALVPELAALAAEASGRTVRGIEDLRLQRWLPVPDEGLRLVGEVRAFDGEGCEGRVLACWGGEDRPLKAERHEVAAGRILLGDGHESAPAPWGPLEGLEPVADPYASASLFHGPAFHLQRDLRRGPAGASARLDLADDPARSDADQAVLLLDALLHGVPHDEPELWLGEAARGLVAYPEQLVRLRFYGALPRRGALTVETRLLPAGGEGLLRVRTQLRGEAVLLEMEHVERLLPKGPLGRHAAAARRRFLAERRFVPDIALSESVGEESRLALAAVQRSNWLPGTLERAYDAEGALPVLAAAIAVKEHFARRFGVHPAEIAVEGEEATCRLKPFRRFPFTLRRGATLTVTSGEPGGLRAADLAAALSARTGLRPSLAGTVLAALACRRFAAVTVAEAAAPLLFGGRGLAVLAPALEGLDGLAVAVVLAALTGRRSDAAVGGAEGAALARLLADAPAARHEPLLRPLDGAERERHLLLRSASTDLGGRRLLRLDWDGDPLRPRLRLRPAGGAAGASLPGPSLSGPSPQALWQDVLATVEHETGFDLAAATWSEGPPATRERAWLARLADWGRGLPEADRQAGQG